MAGNVIKVVMEIPVYKGFLGPVHTQQLHALCVDHLLKRLTPE